MVTENLKKVEKKIESACTRAGRDRNDVTLIAVSKTKPVEMMREAMQCGIVTFGENKVQEIVEKQKELTEPLDWHMIGHLQRNKVKQVVGRVKRIHSVDSIRLAKQIQLESEKRNITSDILIEVNMAKEESKYGFMPEEVEEAIREISTYPNVKIHGLMTIAPNVSNPEENRVHFRNLHKLLVDINGKNIDNINMNELSMGMTGDYEVAIEEGATYVRVGTGIFGKEREDMGLDSILNFFKIPDDFDDEYEEEYVEEPVKAKPVKTQRQPVSQENDYEEPAPKQRSGFLGSKPKVVPMNRTMMEVSIIKPTTFEDSQNICNMLLSGRPVVVNLEGFDPDDAQRIMDFISGCIYSIKGQYHQISKYIFIFTPENVDISGDPLGLDGSSAKMPTINREF